MAWTYDAIIGFSNGMLKGVEIEKKKFKYINLVHNIPLKNMINVNIYDENKIIICAEKTIYLFDVKTKKKAKQLTIRESGGNIVGAYKKNNVLIAGVDNGKVVVKPIKKTTTISEKISTGSHLSCIREVLTLDKFATGGNENPLKIWDLETGKVEFTAKSPKPDMLQLKLPCYVSDIQFFNNNKAVVAHRHGVVDLHDPLSSQRRPVASCKAENTGFVSLRTMPDYSDYEVIVGSSKGCIYHYDFRGKSTLPVKTFRGSTGSVKSVSCINYLNQMHVMSISLDCHVRLHDLNSGNLKMQDYLAAKPKALLVYK